MINYILTALILTLIIPAFGIVMGMLRKIIYNIISVFSPGFAFVLINYLTFPGVIHHELSHAIFGFISGAKIHNITLFHPSGMSLGHVDMSYRGPWALRSIQACVSAAAPVFCGMATSCLLYSLAGLSSSGFLFFLLYYLLFSVLMHMTMSIPDIKCYLKGFIGFFIILLIICILLRFDFISLLYSTGVPTSMLYSTGVPTSMLYSTGVPTSIRFPSGS